MSTASPPTRTVRLLLAGYLAAVLLNIHHVAPWCMPLALGEFVAFGSDCLRRLTSFPLRSPDELEIAIAEHRRGRNIRQFAPRRQGHQIQSCRLTRHAPFIAGALDEELGG